MNHISSLIKVPHKIQFPNRREASPISPLQSNACKTLEKTILDIWPQALVSPYLMIAGTGSRHFHAICENILPFAPKEFTQKDLLQTKEILNTHQPVQENECPKVI